MWRVSTGDTGSFYADLGRLTDKPPPQRKVDSDSFSMTQNDVMVILSDIEHISKLRTIANRIQFNPIKRPNVFPKPNTNITERIRASRCGSLGFFFASVKFLVGMDRESSMSSPCSNYFSPHAHLMMAILITPVIYCIHMYPHEPTCTRTYPQSTRTHAHSFSPQQMSSLPSS